MSTSLVKLLSSIRINIFYKKHNFNIIGSNKCRFHGKKRVMNTLFLHFVTAEKHPVTEVLILDKLKLST